MGHILWRVRWSQRDRSMKTNFFRRFGYYVSIASLLGLTSLFPGPTNLAGTTEVALAASDPVIATAGDIACDPTNSGFNGGNGSTNSCRQKYTSDLLVNAGFAAVLPLGDNQYYCGGYQAFLQSYDLSWGRVKSITRPVVGNHEYLTSGGTGCTLGEPPCRRPCGTWRSSSSCWRVSAARRQHHGAHKDPLRRRHAS